MFLDLTEVEEGGKPKPLPEVELPFQVEKAEAKTFGDDDAFLKVTVCLTVLEGDFQNRKIYQDFIIKHSNPKAANIGKENLKNLVISCGKPETIENVSDLVGGVCIGKVKNQTSNDKVYPKVRYFKKYTESKSESLFS